MKFNKKARFEIYFVNRFFFLIGFIFFQQIPSNTVGSYQPLDPSSISSNVILNDQTRVPAAMRTNLLFGDVRFEDDVKTAKEIERRQWLDDLQKQIEENKRKKFAQKETERRQDFLHENTQPLVQEAANRHQQQSDASSAPSSNTLIANSNSNNDNKHNDNNDNSNNNINTITTTNNNNGSRQDTNKPSRHDSLVQQTYDKIVEATELAKYEKKAQLIEKLRRNGHNTDLLARTLPGTYYSYHYV